MTAERLQELTMPQLRELARNVGIDLLDHYQKTELISGILEAYEEDRLEKELDNNPAMRIKEKKYDIARDEALDEFENEEYPLPEKYNETRVVLLLRDPFWAYVYWDIRKADMENLIDDPNECGLYLRVYEVDGLELKEDTAVSYFDIPIQFDDSSWYINLPVPGRNYCVELRHTVGLMDALFARSNIIRSPYGETTEKGPEDRFKDSPAEFVFLQGLYDDGDSIDNTRIPHRIISLLDTQYLRLQG